jgi:hypothetical protein
MTETMRGEGVWQTRYTEEMEEKEKIKIEERTMSSKPALKLSKI